jgi:predicted MFS family arabinose efflux permease
VYKDILGFPEKHLIPAMWRNRYMSVINASFSRALMYMRGIGVWRLSFYTYFFLVNIGFGMYLTISRDMVREVMGYNYSFMTLVVASENIPLIFSFIGGGLGDVIGRRKLVLLGLLSSIPLFMMSRLSIEYLPLIASLYIFFWSLAQPSITGALLHATSSSGIQYSIYAVFGTIGWGLGGPLAGIITRYYGWSYSWITASIITLSAFIIAYAFFPQSVRGGEAGLRDIVRASKIVLPYFITSLLTMAGFLLFFGNYPLILRSRLHDPELYGLVYTFIPALIGIIARPLIGLLSEKTKPLNLAFTGIILYIVVIAGLYYSINMSVIVMIILWSIPAYPFIDQGFILTFSRSLPGSLQAFASGIWGTTLSIGGFLVLVTSVTPIMRSIYEIYIASETLLFTALILLLVIEYVFKN